MPQGLRADERVRRLQQCRVPLGGRGDFFEVLPPVPLACLAPLGPFVGKHVAWGEGTARRRCLCCCR